MTARATRKAAVMNGSDSVALLVLLVICRVVFHRAMHSSATGISAAREVGLHGGRDEAELYAPDDLRGAIVAEHGLQLRPGPVVVRWVPSGLWPRIKGETAPRTAVLLDLLEHNDPRARREATRALGG
jgi:hypothetical protein